eukprot:Sspe_Gene.56717::Locus_31184_Transcript_1_1_Confidence_1.000_Length_4789::g.56717::m.56717/K10408/DNAH; dynein heavy chain, axonemal
MGKGGGEGKEDEQAIDLRHQWIMRRLAVAFRLKHQELKKLMEPDGENSTAAKEFCETTDVDHAILYVVQKGTSQNQIVLQTDPPDETDSKGKRRVFFFMKIAEKGKLPRLDPQTMHKCVVFGDISPRPIETLSGYTQHILLPLIKSPGNIKEVTEVAKPALFEAVHAFRSQVLVTSGMVEGKTILPLPAIEFPDKVDKPVRDKDLLYQLESVIVRWTAQIKSAMKADPETSLQGHPGPREEMEFWKSKRDNLQNLEVQLHSVKALKVCTMLEKAQSSYYKSLKELLKELRQCTEEAADNYRYLSPLHDVFDTIASATSADAFEKLVPDGTFRLLFHYIYVLWQHSTYYNTPSRVVILIREVCNDLVRSARENVGVEELFTTCEPEEAVKRLSSTLLVCGNFKSWYFHYKTKAAKEGTETPSGERRPARPWKFQNTILFSRLDAFLERCHDLLDVLETVMLFTRLERVEIGGTQGAELSANIEALHQEFNMAYHEFYSPSEPYSSPSGLLDVEETRFDANFAAFREKVRRMDMQLSGILTQSIDDAKALSNVFKVVDTFEGFIDRTLIQQEWQKKQTDVLQAFYDDLVEVQECFRNHSDPLSDPVYRQISPTAAKMVWARGLLERISEPYPRIKELSRPVIQSDLATQAFRLYELLVTNLKAYIGTCYDEWAGQVGATSVEKLKLNLLRREEGGRIKVNFDHELSKLLSEVTHLQVLSSTEPKDSFIIPPQALALYKRRDQFRMQILKLEVVTSTYNQCMDTLLDVEKPLIVAELQQFDDELARGLKRLNWNAGDIDDFIESAMTSILALEHVIKTLKGNVRRIRELLTEYTNEDKFLPLNPKQSKTLSLDDFLKLYHEHRQARQLSLSSKGREVHELMAHSLEALNGLKKQQGLLPLEAETECWVVYVSHVNNIVMNLVCRSVVHSLENLRKQLSMEWLKENDGIPLLDIKLVLAKDDGRGQPEARFVPHLTSAEGPESLDTQVNEWIRDSTDTAQYITRLDALPGSDDSYVNDAAVNKDVTTLHKTINDLLLSNAQACRKFEEQFLAYRSLWEENMKKSFNAFISKPKKPVEEDGEEARGEVPVEEFYGVPLERFDQKISYYEKMLNSLSELPPSSTVGWLRVDSKPIREALKDCCKKWIAMYTGYITDRIETSLTELGEFIQAADAGLDEEVTDAEEDEAALRRVLKHIRDCKVRDGPTKAMFEPISNGLQLLKQHAGAVDEKKLQYLEELRKERPDQWKELDKKYRAVRKANNERQERQGDKLKYQALNMEEDVLVFRRNFKNLRPFQYHGLTVDEAYEELVTWNENLYEREQWARDLNELLELFEKQTTDLPELRECRQELVYLKQLWDMVSHVKSQFTDWWGQTFKTMDAEELTARTRDMLKQMKAMPLKCKSTQTYIGLEEEIRSMLITLPLVENLRNPAMRDRHWRQLLKRCDVDPNAIDPEADNFSLQDLLSLQLHRFEDDVSNIVEKAQKELQIERGLEKVATYWDHEARFEYEFDTGLSTHLLGPIDDIVEVLEEHLNALQAMQSNRFVEEFADSVGKWQRNLGMVESSMVKWMELQKMWKNLYP